MTDEEVIQILMKFQYGKHLEYMKEFLHYPNYLGSYTEIAKAYRSFVNMHGTNHDLVIPSNRDYWWDTTPKEWAYRLAEIIKELNL